MKWSLAIALTLSVILVGAGWLASRTVSTSKAASSAHEIPLEEPQPANHSSAQGIVTDANEVNPGHLTIDGAVSQRRDRGPLATQETASPIDRPWELASSLTQVTFRTPDGAKELTIRCCMAGDDREFRESKTSSQDSTVMALSEGHWHACLVGPEGKLGPATVFEAAGSQLEVELGAPGEITGFFTVLDDSSSSHLPGASVQVARTDHSLLLPSGTLLDSRALLSDPFGSVELGRLEFGSISFDVNKSGYEGQSFVVQLPGAFDEQIASNPNRVDLGKLRLLPLTPFEVQLEGFERWGGAAGFSIAHTHEGERVYFDDLGQATLQLGWHSLPLYLKWWSPEDEQQAIAYLDGGMPPQGEPWIIDVGRSTDVQIDLNIAEKVANAIDLSQSSLRVTSTNARGDAILQGIEVSEPGVYEVRGTGGGSAMVEFASLVGEDVICLALERVELEPEGDTTCVLVVEHLPTAVRFVDAEGSPLANAHMDLRERDNATGWSFGSDADERGEVTVALPGRIDLSMRALTEDGSTLAIDETVQAPPAGEPLTIVLSASTSTRLVVTVDGRRAEGAQIDLFGAHSTNLFRTVETGEGGATPEVWITENSTARATLRGDEYWTPQPFIQLVSGDNQLRAYTKGTLILGTSIEPGQVVHRDEGVSLAAWIQDGRLLSAVERDRSIVVPAGWYDVTYDDGSKVSQLLQAGQEILIQ